MPLLKLPFLGQRDYLHGTTLFDALTETVPAGSAVCFKFSHMIRSDQVEITTLPDTPDEADTFAASLAWNDGGRHGWLGVKPAPLSNALLRQPYAEERVTGPAVFEPNRVRFRGPSPFTLVATLVPLHKALLVRQEVGQGPGQWVFTRLDLGQRPALYHELAVEIEHLLGRRLAKSRVWIDGAECGTIFFSWLTAPG